MCHKDTMVCYDGSCSKSICLAFHGTLEPCDCEVDEENGEIICLFIIFNQIVSNERGAEEKLSRLLQACWYWWVQVNWRIDNVLRACQQYYWDQRKSDNFPPTWLPLQQLWRLLWCVFYLSTCWCRGATGPTEESSFWSSLILFNSRMDCRVLVS